MAMFNSFLYVHQRVVGTHVGVSENRLKHIVPNGFADHYPVLKNVYFIGNINPTFSDKPMVFFFFFPMLWICQAKYPSGLADLRYAGAPFKKPKRASRRQGGNDDVWKPVGYYSYIMLYHIRKHP